MTLDKLFTHVPQLPSSTIWHQHQLVMGKLIRIDSPDQIDSQRRIE